MSQFITKIARPKLLIGEGLEEERLLGELIKKMEISDIQIASYGGKNNLGNYLEALNLIPGFDSLISLGITRDADDSQERAYQSICTSLSNNNFPLPNNQNRMTQVPGAIIISIFILPDNKNPGMLEDLCLQSVDDDPGMPCLEDYFNCIQKKANRQPKNLAKAKIHAWLASQNEPDKRLAEAAKAGYWNWDSPAFEPLKQFILSL